MFDHHHFFSFILLLSSCFATFPKEICNPNATALNTTVASNILNCANGNVWTCQGEGLSQQCLPDSTFAVCVNTYADCVAGYACPNVTGLVPVGGVTVTNFFANQSATTLYQNTTNITYELAPYMLPSCITYLPIDTVSCSANQGTQINISWTAPANFSFPTDAVGSMTSGATYFVQIYNGTSNAGSPFATQTVNWPAQWTEVYGLFPNINYTFQVTAIDALGNNGLATSVVCKTSAESFWITQNNTPNATYGSDCGAILVNWQYTLEYIPSKVGKITVECCLYSNLTSCVLSSSTNSSITSKQVPGLVYTAGSPATTPYYCYIVFYNSSSNGILVTTLAAAPQVRFFGLSKAFPSIFSLSRLLVAFVMSGAMDRERGVQLQPAGARHVRSDLRLCADQLLGAHLRPVLLPWQPVVGVDHWRLDHVCLHVAKRGHGNRQQCGESEHDVAVRRPDAHVHRADQQHRALLWRHHGLHCHTISVVEQRAQHPVQHELLRSLPKLQLYHAVLLSSESVL